MRDETYGISIIGLAAGLYGIFALFHAVEYRASMTKTLSPTAAPETVTVASNN